MVDISYQREYVERYDIGKTYGVTLTDVDEKSEEIYQINKKNKMVYNQTNQKLMKESRYKSQNYLKLLIAKKKEMMMI